MNLKKIIPKGKKADFTSLLMMLGILVILAIGAIIFSQVFLAILGNLKAQDAFSNRTVTTMEIVEDNTIPWLDFLIFFSLVSLMLGLIVSSIFIDVHPAFVIAFIFGLIIAVFIAGQLTNVYSEVTSDSALSETSSQFTYTNLILGEHFPIIILVIGIIIVVVLYGKSGRSAET